MTARQSKPVGELRMSAAEFDRIMGLALRVKPEATKAKKRASTKVKPRKRSATKKK